MAALEMKLPSENVLKHASKLAISDDKPILLDYWTDSCGESASVLIGVKANDEKLLVRSGEEYTSPINKIFKVCDESMNKKSPFPKSKNNFSLIFSNFCWINCHDFTYYL